MKESPQRRVETYRAVDPDSGLVIALAVVGSRYAVAWADDGGLAEAPEPTEFTGRTEGRTAQSIALKLLRERKAAVAGVLEEERLS